MKRHLLFLLILAIPAIFVVANPRRDSASYQIVPETVDSGGGRSTSASYSIIASVGQTVAGTSVSTSYSTGHGFISQLDDPPAVCPLYDAWRLANFGSATSADGALTADPDFDGVNNMAEFAFNLNPRTADAATVLPGSGLQGLPFQQTEIVAGQPRLTLEFIRLKTCGTFTVEASSGLDVWAPIAVTTIGSPVSVATDYERVKVADTVTTAGSMRRFLRLRVALP